jgi:phage baseplate assembly protein W|tara:strand:+ start:41 stop:442 length:402 start_codon:yes stop_codon:yes gene_type:complete
MASPRKSKAFKDISLSFDPHPVTKDIPILANERAITRSVRNLVETIPTERFFDSNLGTNIRELLFENMSASSVMIIEDMVRNTIRNYEPRVGDIGVEVDAVPDDNSVNVRVLFEIIGLEAPLQSFSFILEPTR